MRYLLGGTLLLGAFGIVLPVLIDLPALLRLSEDSGGDYLLVMIAAWTVIYLVAAVLTIRDAVRLVRHGDVRGLRRGALFTKLAGIPFFVLNFLILGLIVQSLLFFGVGFVLAPFFVAWTYLVMLPTSAYGLGLLMVLRRGPGVSSTFFGLHVALHLLFVVDIISSLVVCARSGRVDPGPSS